MSAAVSVIHVCLFMVIFFFFVDSSSILSGRLSDEMLTRTIMCEFRIGYKLEHHHCMKMHKKKSFIDATQFNEINVRYRIKKIYVSLDVRHGMCLCLWLNWMNALAQDHLISFLDSIKWFSIPSISFISINFNQSTTYGAV